jgi:hypothetical protein
MVENSASCSAGKATACLLVLGVVMASLTARAQESEDIEEILAALEAAGLAPSEIDQGAWTEPPPESGKGLAGGMDFSGSVRLRGIFTAPDVFRQDLRLDLRAGPAGGRVRFAALDGRFQFLGGALNLEGNSSRLVMGYTGLQSGLGLLLAAPGRGRSPTADSSFRKPGSRLALWSAAPESHTVNGAALKTTWRRLTVSALAGNSGLTANKPVAQTKALSAGLAWGQGSLGLIALQSGNGQGISLWGLGSQGTLETGGECAVWREGPEKSLSITWEVTATLRPSRAWLFQGAMAESGGGNRSPLGRRSVFQRGDEGSGWGLRGRWSGLKGLQLALLAAESLNRVSLPQPRLEKTRTWDFIGLLRVNRILRLDFRLRSFSSRRWLWDDRFPWRPASLVTTEGRMQGKLGLTWENRGDRLSAAGRVLQTGDSEESARRVLIQVDFRRAVRPWFQVRGAYGTAWADPVDLVSAVSPLPGLVQPRHWGSWRSESLLGIGATGRLFQFWGGVSRRLPSRQDNQVASWQGWLELRAEW